MNEFTPKHITDNVTKRDLWLQCESTPHAPIIIVHSVYHSERHQIMLSKEGAMALLAELQRALAVIAPETVEDEADILEAHRFKDGDRALWMDIHFVSIMHYDPIYQMYVIQFEDDIHEFGVCRDDELAPAAKLPPTPPPAPLPVPEDAPTDEDTTPSMLDLIQNINNWYDRTSGREIVATDHQPDDPSAYQGDNSD